MTTYVMRKGKLVEKHLADVEERPWAVSVISDNMDAVKHHGTGLVSDSKSQFRKMTKASGCVEIGTEAIKPRTPIKLDRGQRREHIRQAIYELRNGRRA